MMDESSKVHEDKIKLKIIHFVSNTDNQETFDNEFSYRLILNDAEVVFNESYVTLKDLISYYKTPRIFPVFFQ